MATYCAICGAPANQDYYTEEGRQEFPFDASHQWLTSVVGLTTRSAIHGKVEDNELISDKGKRKEVGDGLNSNDDNIITIHKACWILAREPASMNKIPAYYKQPWNEPDEYGALWSHPWQPIGKYQQQLFDFYGLKEDGAMWLIADPLSEEGVRNKARILEILSGAFVPAIVNGVDIEQVKLLQRIIDNGPWRRVLENKNYALIREDISMFPKASYPDLVSIRKPYPAALPIAVLSALVDEFVKAIRLSLEYKEVSILLSAITKENICMLSIYTKNSQACIDRIRKLAEIDSPLPSEIVFLHDPGWELLETVRY